MSEFQSIGQAAARVVERVRPAPAVQIGRPGMSIEILTPATRDEWLDLRRHTVGASEVAALLGVHPWLTAYGLFAAKSGLIAVDQDETPAMRRGRLLEDDALAILQEERPDWTVTPNPMPGGHFFRNMAERVSCTPDAFVVAPDRPGRGTAQVKSVQKHVFSRQWRGEDGVIEPPLHVAVQAVQEARLTGAEWAVVVALVVDYGIDAHVIDVPLHPGLIDRIKTETAAFWRGVEAGQPPDADYARDGATIAALYAPDDSLPPVDLSGDNMLAEIVAEREAISERAGADKKRKAAIDAEITAKLAGATVGLLADGRAVTRKFQTRREHLVAESTFPVIRIKKGCAA